MSTFAKLTLSDGTVIPRVGFGVVRDDAFEIRLLIARLASSRDRVQVPGLCPDVRQLSFHWLRLEAVEGGAKRPLSLDEMWGHICCRLMARRIFIFLLGGRTGAAYTDPRSTLVDLMKDASERQMGVESPPFSPRELDIDYGTALKTALMRNQLFGDPPTALPDVWKIMETLKQEGLAKSIGVSNFREEDIQAISSTWTTPPVVNQASSTCDNGTSAHREAVSQIEFHPYIHDENVQRLLQICRVHDIAIEVYGPLSPLFRSPGGPIESVVKDIAADKGITEAQVLLSWAAQVVDGIVITTSSNPGRMLEQLEAITKGPLLSSEQVTEISVRGKERSYRHFMKDVWAGAMP
ncbi:hypothetical protein P7C73_g5612, partial [Tremellales sp. Uapishka_1]